MYQEFKTVVNRNWPELLPEQLDFVLPAWNAFPSDWTGPPQKR